MRHCQAPQSLDTFDPTCSPMLVSTMHLRVALALLRATPCVDEDFQHFSVLGWRASPHHYHYCWSLLLTVPLFGEQLLNFLSPANDKEPARVFIVHEVAKAQDAHSSTQDLSQRAWALAKSPESARCLPQRCLCWSSSSTHVLIGFGRLLLLLLHMPGHVMSREARDSSAGFEHPARGICATASKRASVEIPNLFPTCEHKDAERGHSLGQAAVVVLHGQVGSLHQLRR